MVLASHGCWPNGADIAKDTPDHTMCSIVHGWLEIFPVSSHLFFVICLLRSVHLPPPPILLSLLSLPVLTTMPRRSKTRTKRNFKENQSALPTLSITLPDGHPVQRLLMSSCSQGDHADMKYTIDTLLPGIASARNTIKMIIHDDCDIPQNIPSPFILDMSSVKMHFYEEVVSIYELLLICGNLSFVTLTTVHKHMGKSAVGQSAVLHY